MKSLPYTVFGETNKGLVRATNEDFLLINKEQNLFAIADGLGGLPMGKLASETAITYLASMSYNTQFDFQAAFQEINQSIKTLGATINPDFGIATTLTAIKIQNNTLHGAHIGDTGVFLFKKNSWLKLTQDHTMAEQIKNESNEDVYIPSYYYHILTQCIGKSNDLKIQTFQNSLEPNDRILLYSDGVTLTLTPDELHQLAFESETPEIFVKTIIEKANSRGGTDNITAVAIFTS